jgi:hypothetical protein
MRDPAAVQSAYHWSSMRLQAALHAGAGDHMHPDMRAEVGEIVALLAAAGDHSGQITTDTASNPSGGAS